MVTVVLVLVLQLVLELVLVLVLVIVDMDVLTNVKHLVNKPALNLVILHAQDQPINYQPKFSL